MRTRAGSPSITSLLETRVKELTSDSADSKISLPEIDQAEAKESKRLRAEAKKSVSKTRARLLSEQATCLRVRAEMLPALRKIAQFARNKRVFPHETTDANPSISSTARRMPEVFFSNVMPAGDWSFSGFQPLLQGRLPETADELKQLIIDLPEIHLQTVFGLVWSHSIYVRWSEYEQEAECGIEVTVVCPDVVRINDVEIRLADLPQTDFKSELTRAFYAPRHLSPWSNWEYEKHDNEPRARFEKVRERWNRVWSDRSSDITFLDPLWKRIWYGLEPSDSQAFPLRRRYD